MLNEKDDDDDAMMMMTAMIVMMKIMAMRVPVSFQHYDMHS